MTPNDVLHNVALLPRNLWCSLRAEGPMWVVLPLRGPYLERSVPQPSLPFPFRKMVSLPEQVSLEAMERVFRRIGGARRVQGVVLQFDRLRANLSTLYSLRHLVLHLRQRGKRVVAWIPNATTSDYYLASACDRIVLPPSGRLQALGLRTEVTFLKDTLSLVGVHADFEAIAEYKVAPDTFRRSTMTQPHREMLEAVLESVFTDLVAAIAAGRGLDVSRVRALIDAMPLLPSQAVECRLADAVLYEDELLDYCTKYGSGEDAKTQRPAKLLAWSEVDRRLARPRRRTSYKRIGVVVVEGLIMPGRTRRLPLPVPFVGQQAGATTIVQAVRQAERDRRIAAVVLLVDSPGGSALASDLIWREVWRLRQSKPVVVLMGGRAASGGYLICASAHHIVARPATLTGSIGIWGGKFVLTELLHKLRMGHAVVQCGAAAGLYSELTPFSDQERSRIRRDQGAFYERFKAIVADGRGMTEEQVEEVARGRVWTGAQALEIGLVDELGDFGTALARAKELGGVFPREEPSVVLVREHRTATLPRQLPGCNALAEAFLGSPLAAGSGAMLDVVRILAREHVWALAPFLLDLVAA